jgi:hypothetical protein
LLGKHGRFVTGAVSSFGANDGQQACIGRNRQRVLRAQRRIRGVRFFALLTPLIYVVWNGRDGVALMRAGTGRSRNYV